MKRPHVSIIVVNWNGEADTLDCLASLRQDTYENKEIIVVDNGSHDNSVKRIRSEFPEVNVLETGENLGFTGGNNVGIRHALKVAADHIFLLNNDTTVEPNAVTNLVKAVENNPNYGLLTPAIHYFDRPDEVWFAGSLIDLVRGIAVHDNSRVPERTEAPYEVPWVSGCAMFIPAALLRQLGGFDERYYLNWEDVDLSLRIRGLGYSIALVPAARIYHKVGKSFGRTSSVGCYYYTRNNLLLVRVHAGNAYPRAAFAIVCRRLVENLRATRHRQFRALSDIFTTVRAIRDHFSGRYGAVSIS